VDAWVRVLLEFFVICHDAQLILALKVNAIQKVAGTLRVPSAEFSKNFAF